jgi:hypothetical protein
VDRYAWREGRLAGSERIAVGCNLRQLKARLFALREVRLEVIERALSEAVHATETEDGRVTRVIIERDSYSSAGPRRRCACTSTARAAAVSCSGR